MLLQRTPSFAGFAAGPGRTDGGCAYEPRVSTITLRPWLLVANQFAETTLFGKSIGTTFRVARPTMLTRLP